MITTVSQNEMEAAESYDILQKYFEDTNIDG